MSTSPPPSSSSAASGKGNGIQAKLLKYKYHLTASLAVAAIAAGLIHFAPRFFTILRYFWPLLVSTALCLATVVLFAKTANPSAEAGGFGAGEGLLDFVAGDSDPLLENLKSE